MKHCTRGGLRGYLPEVWGRVSLCHCWCQSPHKGPCTCSRWPAYILNEWKKAVWGGQLAGTEVKQHSGSLNQGAQQKSRTAGIGSLCPPVYIPRLLPQASGKTRLSPRSREWGFRDSQSASASTWECELSTWVCQHSAPHRPWLTLPAKGHV